MNAVVTNLAATRTVAEWRQPLGVDYPGLFRDMSIVLDSGGMERWIQAAEQTISACRIEDLAHAPDRLAFALVWRAQARAMLDILLEIEHLLTRLAPDAREKLINGIDLSFEDQPLEISEKTFQDPENVPLLNGLAHAFETWLVGHGWPSPRPETISERLGAYFAWALDCEWRDHAFYYGPLGRVIETTFTRTATVERSWYSYNRYIRKLFLQPLFGVYTFNIRHLHVMLRAWREPVHAPGPAGAARPVSAIGINHAKRGVICNPYKTIVDWVNSGGSGPDDLIRFAAGPAGSGVATFGCWITSHLSRMGYMQTLYVPISKLRFSGSLVESLTDFVYRQDVFEKNPLGDDIFQPPLLIIFSHLDSLARPGEQFITTARSFLQETRTLLNNQSKKGRRMLALITGWPAAFDAIRDFLPATAEILNLLPYHVSEADRARYEDPEGLLAVDQRDEWWEAFGKAAGLNFKELPQELRDAGREAQALTALPLTNYLIALSYRRGQLDFSRPVRFNHVAEDILDTVWERTFNERRPLKQHHYIDQASFLRALQEVALVIWHQRQGSVTMQNVRDHFDRIGLGWCFNSFSEQARSGVTGLLTVKTPPRSGWAVREEASLEFTKTGFQSLLTAKRIIAELKGLRHDMESKTIGFYTGIDVESALIRWTALCGPAPFDQALLDFLAGQVRLEDRRDAEAWQDLLCRLINHNLKHGPPMDRLSTHLTYREKTHQARNAEEALLAAHQACARATGQTGAIAWPEITSAADWIRKLHGSHFRLDSRMTLHCLCYLDLSDCRLSAMDLWGANLSHTRLSGAILDLACLVEADLTGARLDSARLNNANLQGASLRGADLRRAELKGADLRGADLREADFSGAQLQDADLRGADIKGATFRSADMDDVRMDQDL